jgi:ribosomal protein S18 acetylase RimI-like enzyme
LEDEDEPPPLFEDALRQAVESAEESLEQSCNISVHTYLSDELISYLVSIDHEKFRQELWYDRDVFIKMAKQKAFVCIVFSLNGEPVAFLCGYDYKDEPLGFFLDEVATRVERKGLGKILITLLFVYCYELGYNSVVLYTEDCDQEGRPLKGFYESIGFRQVANDPRLGVVMRYSIEEEALNDLYKRVMHDEFGLFPTYFNSA